MNKFLVFLFFLCAGIHIQASDSNDQISDNHATAIELLEDEADDAAQALAMKRLRSICDKMGDCCLKASVASLGAGFLIMFVTLFYSQMSFYSECVRFAQDASYYEDHFFSKLTSPGIQCFFVCGCSKHNYAVEQAPHIRCSLFPETHADDFDGCTGISNVTLNNFGDPLVAVAYVVKAKWKYPVGCKKYINYDALCKKAKALRRADLCKAAQFQEQRRFFKKSQYKK